MPVSVNVVKSLFFFLLGPGFVLVLVPRWWLLPPGASPALPAGAIGLVPLALGFVVMLWCVLDFATAGRGTPFPLDPPKQLVTRGLYRYVRNPMYWGAGMFLLGEGILFASWPIVAYLAALWLGVHLFVVFYEEPSLTRKFGASYEEFLRSVPRWMPRKRRS